jgi:hypothetical protein
MRAGAEGLDQNGNHPCLVGRAPADSMRRFDEPIRAMIPRLS